MPAVRYYSPLDILEQKLQIERRLGSVKASKYFSLFRRFLTFKISKCEFDRLCIATIGRDVIPLHNHFVRSILKKTCSPKTASQIKSTADSFSKAKTPNSYNGLQFVCKDFPHSPQKVRNPKLRERRFRDRPSPLGSHGKNGSIAIEQQSDVQLQVPSPLGSHGKSGNIAIEQQSNVELQVPSPLGSHGKIGNIAIEQQSNVELQVPSPLGSHGKSGSIAIEQQSNLELQSVSARPPLSMEDGEKFDQDLEILNNHIRRPIDPPLGIPVYNRSASRISSQRSVSSTAAGIGQLPDTFSLKKRLEQELEKEKLNISVDAVNLMNKALDVYLKRLIKPCLDLAASKSVDKFSGPIQPGFNGKPPMHRCVKNSIRGVSASISDFQTAMELDPSILGENWALHHEKICLFTSEE